MNRQIDIQTTKQIKWQKEGRQIDRWTNRWIDAWIDRQIDIQKNTYVDRQIYEQIDIWKDRRIDILIDRQIDVQIYRWIDSQIDRQINKRYIQINKQNDEWMNRRKLYLPPFHRGGVSVSKFLNIHRSSAINSLKWLKIQNPPCTDTGHFQSCNHQKKQILVGKKNFRIDPLTTEILSTKINLTL